MKNLNPTPTAAELVQQIAGDVKVKKGGWLIRLLMGACYMPNSRTIVLPDPKLRDGTSLALAAHEASHAKRHQDGERFYRRNVVQRCLGGQVALWKEEQATNDLAEQHLATVPMDGEQRRQAEKMIRLSRFSYSWKGALVQMVVVNLVVGTAVSVLTQSKRK